MPQSDERTITLAMTGASGVQYGVRLLECLLSAKLNVQLLMSKPAQLVFSMETDMQLPAKSRSIRNYFIELFDCEPNRLQVYGHDQWTAPVASGSNVAAAMVICPCSMATLSAVAVGASRSLLERAADVMLKERRQLILVPRETPFSAIHLENMLRLSQAGAVIMPANPGFYHRPETVQDIIDFVVARVLDHLNVQHGLIERWGEEEIQEED